jgi:hypothetical protein
MCYFVTIGTKASQSEIEALLSEQSLLWARPSKDLDLRTLFPVEDRLYEVLNGQCSCALVIQSDESSLDDERKKQRVEFQKRGWSQAKTARALAGWEEAHERQLRSRVQPAAQFVAMLRGLARRGTVHVFVRSSDSYETPPFRKRSTISLESLSSAGMIDEDTLVTVV